MRIHNSFRTLAKEQVVKATPARVDLTPSLFLRREAKNPVAASVGPNTITRWMRGFQTGSMTEKRWAPDRNPRPVGGAPPPRNKAMEMRT